MIRPPPPSPPKKKREKSGLLRTASTDGLAPHGHCQQAVCTTSASQCHVWHHGHCQQASMQTVPARVRLDSRGFTFSPFFFCTSVHSLSFSLALCVIRTPPPPLSHPSSNASTLSFSLALCMIRTPPPPPTPLSHPSSNASTLFHSVSLYV